MKCKICGAENSEDAKYCKICGSELEIEVFEEEKAKGKVCPKCGAINSDDSNYCKVCAAKLGYPSVFSPNEKNDSATSSLVVAIISISCDVICCLFPLALIIGIVSLVMSIIQLIKVSEKEKGKAIAALIISIIAIIIAFVFIYSTYLVLSNPEFWEKYYEQAGYLNS